MVWLWLAISSILSHISHEKGLESRPTWRRVAEGDQPSANLPYALVLARTLGPVQLGVLPTEALQTVARTRGPEMWDAVACDRAVRLSIGNGRRSASSSGVVEVGR